MRVTLLVYQLEKRGGKERDCLALAKCLLERGHDVTLVTTSNFQELSLPFRVLSLPRSGVFNHARARAFARNAIKQFRDSDSHILVAFEKIPGADFYYAADSAVATGGSNPRQWLPRRRVHLALERGVFEKTAQSRVFFLTERQREEYVAAYEFDRSRSVLLPLILHDERYEAVKAGFDRGAIRDQLDIPRNAVVAISAAVAPMQKGVDRSLAAIADHRDLHLVVVGSTSNVVKRLIGKLNIEDRVRMVPYTSDIMPLLMAADFLIHPARLEAAGQVIAEALLAGIPAIVSESCGYASEVEQTGAGVVIPEPFCHETLSLIISDVIARLPALRFAAATASASLIQRRGLWLSVVVKELENFHLKGRVDF